MTKQINIRTDGLSDKNHILLREYPREAWQAHPNFAQATQNWLGAHKMFRQLGQITRKETERYIDKASTPDDFAARLSYYGDILVRNLHGHHTWEDRSYFPELSAADPRFDAGLAILENDHRDLDAVLDQFTNNANRVIKLIQLEEFKARDEAGQLHESVQSIEALLARHLVDEEDLAVPIILHHKLRG
jgi:iron-sulfur cluster repair protein YtfE (RIC family)